MITKTASVAILKRILFTLKLLAARILSIVAFFTSLLFKPKRAAIPPIEDQILLLPAIKLSERIKSGELKSEQVIRSYIKRISEVNPLINAVIDSRFELALDNARDLDQKLEAVRNGSGDKSILSLPLLGVPLSVKETVGLEGAAFTAGLGSRKLVRAKRSNPGVHQLIQAGCIPICSTNIPCMNLWWDSANNLYGQTKNPYDLSRIPGGSSGGEAAIIAAGGSVIGVGSDMAGSIRIPCSFCCIFGHKATPFAVSNEELYPAMRREQEEMRGVGPMTRFACDLLPMLRAMIRPEEKPKMKLDEPVDLKTIKLYYLEDLGCPLTLSCNSDILSGMRAAVEHLNSKHKMVVRKVTLEEFKYGLFLWSADLNVANGSIMYPEHENGREPFNPFLELLKFTYNGSDYPLNTIITCLIEKFSPTYGSSKQLHLSRKAALLRQKFYELVGQDGVMMMPTHPQPAPYHQTTILKLFNVSYTALANTLRSPITQCPLGMTKEGLPTGVQLIAAPYNDRLGIAIAEELEKAFGGWIPPSRIKI